MPRVLLLQIRDDPRVRREEFDSFVRFTGLAAKQINVLNVFDTPQFPPTVVDGYDAVLVGGASEASVLEPENYSFLAPSVELLIGCIDQEIPVFASCFGFQLAIVALGGEIVRDQDDYEMGTIPISLTDAAAIDPVFAGTPDGFAAVSVHKERATALPSSCELLAYTQACPHAFRIRHKPFWATQFHPEVDKPTLVERLTIYSERYTQGQDHLREVLASAQDTPESNELLHKFVQRILCSDPEAGHRAS
jgi:GMP synthase (glutamine-hydrolysing)